MKRPLSTIAVLGFMAFHGHPVAAQTPDLRPVTVNPLEKSSGEAVNLNAFNPAFGLTLDGLFSAKRNERSHFSMRSAELNFTAAIDPFANLYAVINATPDEVELEEAAFITTSLPYNLTVRGGRFFANFGRLPHWHPHEHPVAEGLQSIEAMIGGESKADGLELIHLFKTPFFLQGTLGAYNKIGAENTRLEETDADGHTNGRPAQAMTYLARLLSYIPMGETTGMDVGVSHAMTPRQYYIGGVRVDHMNTQRQLSGIDLTLRHEATGANQVGRFLWGTEIFRNDERRRDELAVDSDGDGTGDTDAFNRYYTLGGYSYVDYRFAPRWSSGAFLDYTEDPENLKNRDVNQRHYGAMLNFLPSEFQKIRFQYSQAKLNDGSRVNHQFFVQWFASIGTHVHLFKDR